MKKLISVLVIALLLLQCTACTGKTTENNVTSTVTKASSAADVSQTETVKEESASSQIVSSEVSSEISGTDSEVSSLQSEETVSKTQSVSSKAESSIKETVVSSTSSKETVSQNESEKVSSKTEETESKPNYRTKYKGEDFEVSMTFTGDMILASYLNQSPGGTFDEYAENHKPAYFLKEVKHIFEADDFTIVNLENVFSDRKGLTPRNKGEGTAFWFKAKTKNLKILTEADVEAVSLENNHTRDYGETGYRDTVKAVENYGLKYGDSSKVMYFTKKGFTIGVVCVGIWGEYNVPTALNLLKAAKRNSHYQVVFFHGGTERLHEPETWKKNAARKLVDNGADLVVGSHPHVLQPRETYKGVEIVYSLGNFCFGGNRAPENRTIIYQMNLSIGKDYKLKDSQSKIIPCYVYTGSRNNFQPAPITNSTHKKRVLDFMDWKRSSPF